MSLAYSPQMAQLSSSSRSMSMISVHIRLELSGSGEERSMGEPNEPKRDGDICDNLNTTFEVHDKSFSILPIL